MNLITQYFTALWDLLKDLGIYFLFGFIIAAFVKEFVSNDEMLKLFGKNDILSLLRAVFSGLVISVCSCGAIPIAAMLRKSGTSTATSLTFLLATPWAGFMHIAIIAGFIGIKNALLLFSLSLVVALLTGLILAQFENRGWIEQKLSTKHKKTSKTSCACDDCCDDDNKKKVPLLKRLFISVPKQMWEILTDVGKYLLIGIFLSAALKAFVPQSIVYSILGKGPLSILLALPIAAVIELCSEGFSVFAGQLFQMGATLGVVFTMIMVGVSTDITELSMIWGKFGKRSMFAYLFISTAFVLIFALMLG
ncbi:MAG: permease [Nanoarchaeota archaeon]|nr:permease [Nanoarchaeota archaeon]